MKGRIITCPKCGSKRIGQFRTFHGPIWCNSCGFRAANKEISNPFIIKNTIKPVRFKQ